MPAFGSLYDIAGASDQDLMGPDQTFTGMEIGGSALGAAGGGGTAPTVPTGGRYAGLTLAELEAKQRPGVWQPDLARAKDMLKKRTTSWVSANQEGGGGSWGGGASSSSGGGGGSSSGGASSGGGGGGQSTAEHLDSSIQRWVEQANERSRYNAEIARGDAAAAKISASQAAANAANNARYQKILGLYEGVGEAGMARIGRAEEQAMATGEQDLISRGLGSTTIRGSMARGVRDDAELQRQQLQEGVSMQKAGVMERRTDAGPDVSLYSQLLQQG